MGIAPADDFNRFACRNLNVQTGLDSGEPTLEYASGKEKRGNATSAKATSVMVVVVKRPRAGVPTCWMFGLHRRRQSRSSSTYWCRTYFDMARWAISPPRNLLTTLTCYMIFLWQWVEAKRKHKVSPGDGLRQARNTGTAGAETAYSTNGTGIVGWLPPDSWLVGLFSAPPSRAMGKAQAGGRVERWSNDEDTLWNTGGKVPRYYQRIAINQRAPSDSQDQQNRLLLSDSSRNRKRRQETLLQDFAHKDGKVQKAFNSTNAQPSLN